MILSPMTKIVRVFSNFIYGFTIVFGFYVVLHGHLTPGGGFQGGAVIASGIALMVIAYGIYEINKHIKKNWFSAGESLGLLGFICVALLGLVSGIQVFFANYLAGNNTWHIFSDHTPIGSNPGYLNTGGTLPLMSLAVGMEVAAGLSLIILFMASGFYIDRMGQGGDEQ